MHDPDSFGYSVRLFSSLSVKVDAVVVTPESGEAHVQNRSCQSSGGK